VLAQVLISQGSLISKSMTEIIRAVFFAAEDSGNDILLFFCLWQISTRTNSVPLISGPPWAETSSVIGRLMVAEMLYFQNRCPVSDNSCG